MKRIVQVALDEDTAEFLESCRAHGNREAVSAFINSLIRHERFRHGYPAWAGPDISQHPVTSPEEKVMLQRSGLLPLNPRYR